MTGRPLLRWLCLLPLAGCAHAPVAVPAAAPRFSAQAFFAGRTHGDGVLKIVMQPRQRVVVDGSGRVEADGTLVLDQTVTRAGKPPERRQWRIREMVPGRYAGTLSDAAGPIAGEVTGNRLHLHFRMAAGLTADQWLDLSADGQSAANRMVVTKFGVAVARLDETIRRAG